MDGRSEGTPLEHERAIAASVQQLPEYALVEGATSVLAVVIDRLAAVEPLAEEASRTIRTALLAASIRAFRTIRSGSAITVSGYEPEADAMTRIVLELNVAANEFLADASGERATRWLRHGMGGQIRSRVDGAVLGEPVYKPLSFAAHGDPRALLVLAGTESGALEWGPRTTIRATEILRCYAIAARDFAVLLERTFDQPQPELERLDAWLVAAVPGFSPSKNWREADPDAA